MIRSLGLFAALCALILVAPSTGVSAQTPRVPADLVGDWSGLLQTTTGQKVHLIFHIRADAPSTMDSPDQGAVGLPVASVSDEGGQARFTLGVGGIYFDAPRGANPGVLDGQFHQGAASIPLTLTHGAPTAPAAAPNRPQTPQPPFPYRSEDVAYENTAQNVHLAGTLTLPQGKGPFPAVLLITGSGQQDRDETILGHKPFLVIADYLTRRGIAVLRVDDRGAGQSTGNFAASTTADFATDAEASVAYLKTRPDIDKRHIGLIGHSEGGIIAPMVAAKDPTIAFIVMMAGPASQAPRSRSIKNQNVMQVAGAPQATIDANLARLRKLYAEVGSDDDAATEKQKLTDMLAAAGAPPEQTQKALAQLTLPWTRWFFRHDPAPVLAKVHCPVLAIGGSKDTQVPVAINLPAIRAALKSNPDATVEELPGLNHLFQTAGTGNFDEYAKIEETIAPSALKVMGDWIAGK